MRRGVNNRRAFSLIEMVVAAVLLSSGVVVLSAVSARSLRAVKLNRENESAWEILDRQLTLIDYVGIDEFISAGQMEGKFGEEDEGQSVYYWEAEVDELEPDNLYRLDVTVSWGPEKKRRWISASTMLKGSGVVLVPTEDEGAL